MQEAIPYVNAVCALVSAKWALELGFSQLRQILILIGGLIFGPLMLLILYVYLILKARREGAPGGKVI